MQNFRHKLQEVQCDDTADDEKLKQIYFREQHCFPNLWFYQNKLESRPDGVYIDEFHRKWFGDYTRLERVQSFIQWLFPIQEQALNYDAHLLTPEEIKLFRKDKEAKRRLLESYKLMLDFYGIKLLDEETGEVCRAENWKERFRNLNRNTHNNLRITRILKCLGILGLEHYQAPLVRFFLEETLVNRELPNVKQSVLDYFMFAVLDTSKRKKLIKYAFENFKPEKDFVWCPLRIQKRFKKEITSRKPGTPDTHPSESSAKSKETDLQTELESQTGSSNNVAETGDANGNSANSPPDHKNEPKTEPSLDPSDVTTGNEKASDSDKVNEESSNEMPGSNTTQDAFGDSAESPPFQIKQDCDNNADDASVVKNDTEVHEDTVQSGHAPVSVSSDLLNTEPVSDENRGDEQIMSEHQDQQTSHDHLTSITEAVDEIQVMDSGGCNHTEPGNENVSGGADTQEIRSECSIIINNGMCEVSNEEESSTTGDSREIPPIQKKQDSDNNAVDALAVKNDSEGHKHTEQSGQAPVSMSSELANQEPVSDRNNRNGQTVGECQNQETSRHHPTFITKAIDSGKMSPAIQNSGNEDDIDVDTEPLKKEHASTEESAVMIGSEGCRDTELTGQISVPQSVTCDVDLCDDEVSNVQASNMRNEEADSSVDRNEDDVDVNTGDKCERVQLENEGESTGYSGEAGVRWPTSSDF